MKITQSRIFANKVKKLSKTEKSILDKEIKLIVKNPQIGIEKKADLRGVYVYKFKINTLQYLLSYRFSIEEIEFIMLGSHENYYRDLKKYV
ncbi:MAG: type II toxin-antitoxin system RelE/ParE family toxin [Candidatus Marinimicrobia bacterium]|nr:type II toxin-antitoxin system RelE/ParE family toxin [Candidatus Neomarinimicrobiota bacterium]